MRNILNRYFAPTLAASAIFTIAIAAQPTFNPQNKQDPGPVLTNHPFNFKEFAITSDVVILGPDDLTGRKDIRLDRFSIAFPIPPSTSAHHVYPDTLTGELRVEHTLIDEEPRILDGYQGGTTLALWESYKDRTIADDIRLRLTTEVVCFETRIDEPRAATYPWPEGDLTLPPEVASMLEPQLFIESDDPRFAQLVNHWTNNNPRNVTPYILAKHLAANLIEYYTPTGVTFEAVTRGPGPLNIESFANGFRVRGAVNALEQQTGPPLDLPNLLAALYRAAGIPARVVIALELNEQSRSDSGRYPTFTAWTEFWIYDPKFERGEWIPVDIIRQRAWAGKAPPLDIPWEFFGRNLAFDRVIPLSFHWHPPTTLINAGAPALWGWLPEPDVPAIDQVISFTTIGRPLSQEKLDADQDIFLERTGKPRNGPAQVTPTSAP